MPLHFEAALSRARALNLSLVGLLFGLGCDAVAPPESVRPSNPTEAQLQRYTRVDIYYLPWSATYQVPPTPDNVRAWTHEHFTITDPIHASQLAFWCDLEGLSSVSPSPSPNTRLVLDFKTATGATETYYATPDLLLNQDGTKGRLIDQTFRRTICEGLMFQQTVVGYSCE